MRMSHIVLKASDLTKALENLPKGNHDFNNILSEYSKVRKDQGKLSDHRYIVVNMDEPYVNDVIAVLEKNGHWGENPSEFTHAEIQTALQESYEDMLKVEIEHQQKALEEIKEITKGLAEFNSTYEKIHKIASKGLVVKVGA
ncbi:hypothetical protein MTP04_02380 [Lysinibacillus sp. PLM2]|nr:hypothetical protein MTP04_02380 [Lysinibacillus sp. PLM2]